MVVLYWMAAWCPVQDVVIPLWRAWAAALDDEQLNELNKLANPHLSRVGRELKPESDAEHLAELEQKSRDPNAVAAPASVAKNNAIEPPPWSVVPAPREREIARLWCERKGKG